MNGFSEECIEVFLRDQSQLFDEPVAETPEEAEEAAISDALSGAKKDARKRGAASDLTTSYEKKDKTKIEESINKLNGLKDEIGQIK